MPCPLCFVYYALYSLRISAFCHKLSLLKLQTNFFVFLTSLQLFAANCDLRWKSTSDKCVSKAWFKRRILHAPNQILILVDSNEYVRLI